MWFGVTPMRRQMLVISIYCQAYIEGIGVLRYMSRSYLNDLLEEISSPHPTDCRDADIGKLLGRHVHKILKLVDEQANDEGLWSIPIDRLQSISEAYLQQELRKLHYVIENMEVTNEHQG